MKQYPVSVSQTNDGHGMLPIWLPDDYPSKIAGSSIIGKSPAWREPSRDAPVVETSDIHSENEHGYKRRNWQKTGMWCCAPFKQADQTWRARWTIADFIRFEKRFCLSFTTVSCEGDRNVWYKKEHSHPFCWFRKCSPHMMEMRH